MSHDFDPNDPRLTAFVLGELDAEEAAEIERLLETSTEARTAVAEIRDVVGRLETELAAEPLPERTLATRPAAEPVSSGRRSFAAIALAAGSLVAVGLLVVFLGNGQVPRESARRPESTETDGEFATQPLGETTVGARLALGDEWYFERPDDAVTAAGDVERGHAVQGSTPSFSVQNRLAAGDLERGHAVQERPRHADSRFDHRRPSQPAPANAERVLTDGPVEAARPQSVNGPREEHLGIANLNGRLAGSESRERLSEANELRTRTRELERPARPAAVAGVAGVVPDSDATTPLEAAPAAAPPPPGPLTGEELGFAAEAYHPIVENAFLSPFQQPLSTFSIDVDTAAYSNVRRFVNHGQLPPADAVRVEEMLNYFSYDYPQPEGDDPFSATLEAGPCPWNSDHRLVRIGLKSREIPHDERPPSNLVFLLDVSGSMRDANKLPLVQHGMKLLAEQMTEDDRIAIVTYAGNAGLQLDSTSGDDRGAIVSTINGLTAGGSTNGEAGLHLAYQKAVENFVEDGTNRVVLCTDGDFNVGVSGDDELVRVIEDKAKSGVFLSVFGFGMGNLKDGKLEQLADKGNGQYGYVDDQREARKVFVEEMAGTLYTIAKDVKIQVEFNPARVGAYRLIGYENRVLAARDFDDDTKDAGEIGAGHTVTALYEIVPPEALAKQEGVGELKYQKAELTDADRNRRELLTLKLRYKQPDGEVSVKREFPLVDDGKDAMPSRDFEWATAVAAYGMVLRNSAHKGAADLDLVAELAAGAQGDDPHGHRGDFVALVEATRKLFGGK